MEDVKSFFDKVAPYYDRIVRMAGADYPLWSKYLKLLLSQNAPGNRVLDISAGTGSLDVYLLREGFDVYAMDISTAMLKQAPKKGLKGRVVAGSFDAIPFASASFDAAISTFDSLNTVLSSDDLLRIFREVNRILVDGGVFLFDMNSPYSYRTYWDGLERVDEEENLMVVWRAVREGAITRLRIDVFFKGESGWKRVSGELLERAYSLRAINGLLRRAGFSRAICLNHLGLRSCGRGTMRYQMVAYK